jgi:hypothetical protein
MLLACALRAVGAGARPPIGAAAAAAAARGLATAPPAPAQLAAIKALRESSGAPMSDVKAALVEAGWDGDAAFAALRKKGLAAAQKKVRSQLRASALSYRSVERVPVRSEVLACEWKRCAPPRGRKDTRNDESIG